MYNEIVEEDMGFSSNTHLFEKGWAFFAKNVFLKILKKVLTFEREGAIMSV